MTFYDKCINEIGKTTRIGLKETLIPISKKNQPSDADAALSRLNEEGYELKVEDVDNPESNFIYVWIQKAMD